MKVPSQQFKPQSNHHKVQNLVTQPQEKVKALSKVKKQPHLVLRLGDSYDQISLSIYIPNNFLIINHNPQIVWQCNKQKIVLSITDILNDNLN